MSLCASTSATSGLVIEENSIGSQEVQGIGGGGGKSQDHDLIGGGKMPAARVTPLGYEKVKQKKGFLRAKGDSLKNKKKGSRKDAKVVPSEGGSGDIGDNVIKVKKDRPSSMAPDMPDGKVLKEDTLECLSRNRDTFRLILTTNQVILQDTKNHSRCERYSIQDLFGCHTLRHKKTSVSNSAFVCFYLYPRTKKVGLMNPAKLREKITLVFDIKKPGNSYEENLSIATEWKQATLGALNRKYPKWQLKSNNSIEERKTEDDCNDSITPITNLAIDSQDTMDHIVYTGESNQSLSSYLLYIRRFLVVLNPKSGQGKTMEMFQEKIAPILKEAGIKIELLVTQHPGHARNMMSSSDLSEIDGIVTVGGDGILYEVVNGLRCRADSNRVSNIPIGVIAGGSGNGLARSIAEYSGEAADYLKNPVLSTTLAAARGKSIQVNLCEVELDTKKIYSFLSVGWGLLADIDVESEVLRTLGESRFTIWSFYRLIKLRSYKATLSYIPWNQQNQDTINGNVTTSNDNGDSNSPDRVTVDSDFVCVYSACQSYIGSDLVFAPKAEANDGLIHLIYIPGDVGRTRSTQFLISIDKGSHLDVEGVKYVTVKEFSISREGGIGGNLTIDGEKVTGEKITVRVSPKPLNMFAL